MARHDVRVEPIPAWVDLDRLLGPGAWEIEGAGGARRVARAELDTRQAADLAARLRGLVLGGVAVSCTCAPALPRGPVREARTIEARRLRETTPGFERRGARVDEEGRWSLTPERIAVELGRAARAATVVDAGCGVGGNTIGFARAGARVVAVEADPGRLEMARHNARLYEVDARIDFRRGDALELVPRLEAELLFLDPPWGVDWKRDPKPLRESPLLAALPTWRQRYPRVWVKLPPSFDPDPLDPSRVSAVFGAAPGDRQRIKFLLVELGPSSLVGA